MSVKFHIVRNNRTDDGGFATNKRCGRCSNRSSAYLEITIKEGTERLYRPTVRDIICVSCLDVGIALVHESILFKLKEDKDV